MSHEISDARLSEAIVLMLSKSPASNMEEFHARYEGEEARRLDKEIDALLQEAMCTKVDWSGKSLSEGGAYVQEDMKRKHPRLSAEALGAMKRYYTYQMR